MTHLGTNEELICTIEGDLLDNEYNANNEQPLTSSKKVSYHEKNENNLSIHQQDTLSLFY